VRRKRVGVLISGRGSNLAALIAAAQAPDFSAEIRLVASNRPEAGGLRIAAENGIPAIAIDQKAFAGKAAFEARLDEVLRAEAIDLVCLAGFMRLLSPHFVELWRDRLLNIHPSLLPAFPGLDTHRRALAAGVKLHGATVHFVREETDSGPIVAQAAVPVREGDTPETLSTRVLAAEHRLYPLALKLVASGTAKVADERVVISGVGGEADAALFSPPDAHG
jgi:phosphoribosylglycinamide formyltransferase 1